MFNVIKRLVAQEIERRAADIPKPVRPPEGYNSAEAIRGAMFLWIPVPVNGVRIWMELRTLNASQLDACGAVSLCKTQQERKEAPSYTEAIEIRNRQEKIIRETMNRPTFDEFLAVISDSDFVLAKKREELAEIKKIDISTLSEEEKRDIEARCNELELALAFLIPEDTFNFLTEWALCSDVSDIKRLSHEQYLKAALLAERGHDNPSDHLSGVFTDRDKIDIDNTAWGVFADFRREQSVENNVKRIGRK
jgi:hypothetical protein